MEEGPSDFPHLHQVGESPRCQQHNVGVVLSGQKFHQSRNEHVDAASQRTSQPGLARLLGSSAWRDLNAIRDSSVAIESKLHNSVKAWICREAICEHGLLSQIACMMSRKWLQMTS